MTSQVSPGRRNQGPPVTNSVDLGTSMRSKEFASGCFRQEFLDVSVRARMGLVDSEG